MFGYFSAVKIFGYFSSYRMFDYFLADRMFSYLSPTECSLIYRLPNVRLFLSLSGSTGSALVWHSKVARSRLTQCSKSCALQPALQCAIHGRGNSLSWDRYAIVLLNSVIKECADDFIKHAIRVGIITTYF